MKKTNFFIVLLFLAAVNTSAQANIITKRDSLKFQLARATNDIQKFNLLMSLGGTYWANNNDSAAYYLRQGWELSQKINYKKGIAISSARLSGALTLLGNMTGALDFGLKSLALSKKLGDSLSLALAYLSLNQYYKVQQNYKKALQNGFQALRYGGRFNGKNGSFYHGVIFGFIGSTYYYDNKPDSALYYDLKAYHLAPHWSGAYRRLGRDYAKKQEYGQALTYLRKGIPLAEKQQIYLDIVVSYTKMSKIFESIGEMDSSLYYAQKAMNQKGINTIPTYKLDAYNQAANIYEQTGAKDSTIKYLKLSAALREQLVNRQKIREAQTLLFNQQIHQQELRAQKEQASNRTRIAVLIAVVIAILLIAVILFWNNRMKQKTNSLLRKTLSDLRATQSQLVQSEKMASLGELTAGIAHEIQNPLNFVNNFAEVNFELIDEMDEEIENGNLEEIRAIAKDLKENEQKINHHGKRAELIVKGMLLHSRGNSGQKELTDINAIADEYLRLSYHGLRAKDKSFNADFKLEGDKTIPKIKVVPQDIGRVFLNLINNAFYAVTEKAKRDEKNFKPEVVITTAKRDSAVEIRIKDNGDGIPEAIREKIFQPFFTTKPTGIGTGLGLSLSYDIITKGHHGKLKVYSETARPNDPVGKETGTEFLITLPLES